MSDIIKDAEKKMGSAVDHAREEFAAIRTGRCLLYTSDAADE